MSLGDDFLSSFNNELENRGLPGSSVELGPGWAYALAAPLRLMKGYQSQGGVLSPLIVKPPHDWKIANRVITAPVHTMDIMPTLVDVADAELSVRQLLLVIPVVMATAVRATKATSAMTTAQILESQ